MRKSKLQLDSNDVKWFWCLSPEVGFYFFGIINLIALVVFNTFLLDYNQLLWLVMQNLLVLTPVIIAYLIALGKGAQNKEHKKTYFIACFVNNIGLIGLFIIILTMYASSNWYAVTSAKLLVQKFKS